MPSLRGRAWRVTYPIDELCQSLGEVVRAVLVIELLGCPAHLPCGLVA
jgi:hypothetical protein